MFWKSLFQNRKVEYETDIINIRDHDKISLFEEILKKGLCLKVKVTGKSMAPFFKWRGDSINKKSTAGISLYW